MQQHDFRGLRGVTSKHWHSLVSDTANLTVAAATTVNDSSLPLAELKAPIALAAKPASRKSPRAAPPTFDALMRIARLLGRLAAIDFHGINSPVATKPLAAPRPEP